MLGALGSGQTARPDLDKPSSEADAKVNRNNIYQYAKLVKSINLVIIMQRTNTHYTLSVTNTFKYFSHLLNEEYQTQLFYTKYKNQILF